MRTHQWDPHLCVPLQNPIIIFSSFSHHFLHDLVILGNPLFVTKRYFEPGVKRIFQHHWISRRRAMASLRPISPCRGPGWGRRLYEDVQEGMETGHH